MDKNLAIVRDFFEFSFTKEEQKQITKNLYTYFREDKSYYPIAFSKLYSIPYKVMFGNITYEDSIEFLLSKFYRNEYFIKRRFVKQEINHFFACGYTEEVPISNSRLDLGGLDHKNSYAFEIKTKYDSLARLSKQIDDYSKCFEKIYVICSDDKEEDVRRIIPDYCGVIGYEDRSNCHFHIKKEASDSCQISSLQQLNFMLKSERMELFGQTDVSSIKEENDSSTINQYFKKALQARIELRKFTEAYNDKTTSSI